MALTFDETVNDCPAWAKECLTCIASDEEGKAMKLARESFEAACKRKDIIGKFWSLLIIAKIHLGMGEMYDAKAVLDKALSVLGKAPDDKAEAAAMHTLAKVNLKLCKSAAALEAAEAAAAKYSKTNGKAAEAAVQLTMADVHLASGKKQEALKFYKQAVQTFKDTNEKLGEAAALATHVKINLSMKKYEEALRSANEIMGIYQGSSETSMMGAAMLLVSDVRKAMSEPAEAEEMASKAVSLFEEGMNKREQAVALRKLADTCFVNNNPTDGWTYIKEARELCMSMGNKKLEASILEYFAAAHIQEGRFEEGIIGDEAIKLCREADLKEELASCLWTMADGHMAEITAGAKRARDQHLNYQARTKGKEALALYQQLGNLPGQAKCLYVLSWAFLSYGNYLEGKAKAKAAIQLSKETDDKEMEGMSLMLLAQARLYDNKDEALRLAKLAEKLLKETGSTDQIKGAEDVVEFIRDFERTGGKKEKEGKTKLSDIQSEKTDTTMDLDFGKSRGAYFHGFTARTARASR